jgi:iron complex outermembrane receptor protein
VSYRSKTNQFETPSPFLDQPGYALFDASLVWTSSDDRFTIGLHGKNLTDKQYITSGYQFLNVNPVTGVPILSATRTAATFNQPGVAPRWAARVWSPHSTAIRGRSSSASA